MDTTVTTLANADRFCMAMVSLTRAELHIDVGRLVVRVQRDSPLVNVGRMSMRRLIRIGAGVVALRAVQALVARAVRVGVLPPSAPWCVEHPRSIESLVARV